MCWLNAATHIDGSVGLDVVHVGVGQTQLLAASLHWTDDAWSYRVPQSKRAAHRNHKLALANVGRAAEGQRGQRILHVQRRGAERIAIVVSFHIQNKTYCLWLTLIDSLFDIIDIRANNDDKSLRHTKSPAFTHPCSDFDGGDVRHRINILHSGIVRVTIGELHSHSSLVGHDVSVGDDEAVAADDETRAIGHGDFSPRKRVPVK